MVGTGSCSLFNGFQDANKIYFLAYYLHTVAAFTLVFKYNKLIRSHKTEKSNFFLIHFPDRISEHRAKQKQFEDTKQLLTTRSWRSRLYGNWRLTEEGRPCTRPEPGRDELAWRPPAPVSPATLVILDIKSSSKILCSINRPSPTGFKTQTFSALYFEKNTN